MQSFYKKHAYAKHDDEIMRKLKKILKKVQCIHFCLSFMILITYHNL